MTTKVGMIRSPYILIPSFLLFVLFLLLTNIEFCSFFLSGRIESLWLVHIKNDPKSHKGRSILVQIKYYNGY